MSRKFAFCPYCAAAVKEEFRFNEMRPVCSACGFVQFFDPKVAVIALVERGHEVLLVKRAVDPAKGLWSLPGGYMDAGEMPQEALRRELEEEVGLSPRIGGLLDIYPMEHDSGQRVGIVLAYQARVSRSQEIPFAADDAQEAGWFAPHELPSGLAFDSTRLLLQAWQASAGCAGDPE